MANNSNFRIKVDLTKYHQDVRRFSWIFIDITKCSLIFHVKQHIINIFGIQEPFNLLLNDNEFLPPNEDVRVLKENETIAVVPESRLYDDEPQSSNHSSVVNSDRIQSMNLERQEITQTNGQKDSCDDSLVGDVSNAATVSEVTEIESASDSKIVDDNAIENNTSLDICEKSLRKRKRTRRKKSKKETEGTFMEDVIEKLPTRNCKPQIIQSYVLPAGKHIRFNSGEIDKLTVVEDTGNNCSSEKSKVYKSDFRRSSKDSTIAANLSTLLALGKYSAPITFEAKKVNQRIDNAVVTEELSKTSSSAMDLSSSFTDIQEGANEKLNGHKNLFETRQKQINYSQLNIEKYPILTSPPEINDTIAFKILRIGENYSPEISDHIIAKTRSWCPEKLLFTFEILQGKEQIQTPMGKFTLPENDLEIREEIETANFNFSQLIEPRRID